VVGRSQYEGIFEGFVSISSVVLSFDFVLRNLKRRKARRIKRSLHFIIPMSCITPKRRKSGVECRKSKFTTLCKSFNNSVNILEPLMARKYVF